MDGNPLRTVAVIGLLYVVVATSIVTCQRYMPTLDCMNDCSGSIEGWEAFRCIICED